ncbi:hypothetical protein CDEST_01880 [Colletotrichum destructivum]|uniref:Uncharacterized protein n=1 Tax=Colletotrichum destructivum TaxID=34406 RepID=A0AAX4I0B7_9PEZI|nr:hypothetical protein CDEST_01880 [Colletotrichum destructivum]
MWIQAPVDTFNIPAPLAITNIVQKETTAESKAGFRCFPSGISSLGCFWTLLLTSYMTANVYQRIRQIAEDTQASLSPKLAQLVLLSACFGRESTSASRQLYGGLGAGRNLRLLYQLIDRWALQHGQFFSRSMKDFGVVSTCRGQISLHTPQRTTYVILVVRLSTHLASV